MQSKKSIKRGYFFAGATVILYSGATALIDKVHQTTKISQLSLLTAVFCSVSLSALLFGMFKKDEPAPTKGHFRTLFFIAIAGIVASFYFFQIIGFRPGQGGAGAANTEWIEKALMPLCLSLFSVLFFGGEKPNRKLLFGGVVVFSGYIFFLVPSLSLLIPEKDFVLFAYLFPFLGAAGSSVSLLFMSKIANGDNPVSRFFCISARYALVGIIGLVAVITYWNNLNTPTEGLVGGILIGCFFSNGALVFGLLTMKTLGHHRFSIILLSIPIATTVWEAILKGSTSHWKSSFFWGAFIVFIGVVIIEIDFFPKKSK